MGISKNFRQNAKNRVLVAMSGGVDSSVAAALLKEQGYGLVGVTMNLACTTSSSDRSCCSLSAASDAKKVADRLGFPHYVLNYKDEFKHFVIDNFIDEYRSGRTPNPCVRCNQFIKFDLLLKKAKELDCDYVATGHYARIKPLTPYSPSPLLRGKGIGDRGGYQLLKGKDTKKDQSYFLYTMTQEQLAQTLFPLGELTKGEVRKLARKHNLPVAEKKESQEICFVEEDDYNQFIREKAPELIKPGKIVNIEGNVVGEHQGIAFYTIGQRKGIGAHQGKAKYVVAIDPPKNLVIVGDDQETLKTGLWAEEVKFISGDDPIFPLKVTAKIRYNAAEVEATLIHKTQVLFVQPQRAVTPGQSIVFYKGDEVLGGGIISRKD